MILCKSGAVVFTSLRFSHNLPKADLFVVSGILSLLYSEMYQESIYR